MAVVLVALPLLFDNVTIVGITFDQFWIGVFAQGMALAIIYLSYTLVTGEGGMISLCQITLAGIGAFAAARLAAEAGWPVWLAILVGALVAVPFGLLVALPSLRIGDLYLALLTLGFALLVEQFVWIRAEYENFGAGVPDRRGRSGSGSPTESRCTRSSRWCSRSSALADREPETRDVGSRVRGHPVERAGVDHERHQHRAGEARCCSGSSAFVAGLGGALYATVVGQRDATLVQRARRHRVARHRGDLGRALGRRRAARGHDLRDRAAAPLDHPHAGVLLRGRAA